MISRDPKCVFVANDASQAMVVANSLEHQGIPAKVMDTMTLGGLDGLTAWTGVSARGIEVWVLQPSDAERARALLEEQKETKNLASQPILAYCDQCGNATEFPREQRDTFQECPHCGTSISVSDRESEGEERSVRHTSTGRKFGLRSLQKPIIFFFLVSIAILFCLQLVGVLISELTADKSATWNMTPAEGERFYDSVQGYSIQFPGDWQREQLSQGRSPDEPEQTVTFVGPPTSIGMFSTRITITSREIDPGDFDFDDYFKRFLAITTEEGDEVQETGTMSLDDTEAFWGVISSPDGVTVLQYVVNAERRVHFITCFSSEEAFDFHRGTYEDIVKTFAVD